MFDEWESKQTFLRQANRMVTRESLRALREMPEGSEERKNAALELCKSAGIVTELLEERNEMSETPLIREVRSCFFLCIWSIEPGMNEIIGTGLREIVRSCEHSFHSIISVIYFPKYCAGRGWKRQDLASSA